jgi:plasmid stability protein
MTMTVQSLTLNVPEALYHRLKRRAEQTHRPVEDEALDVLAAGVPVADELPPDLVEAISPLALLDDEALERAAGSRLAAEAAAQMEELHLKRQRQGLTDAEAQTLAALVRQYERAMLVRAQAAALLHQRGHDVTPLLTPP